MRINRRIRSRRPSPIEDRCDLMFRILLLAENFFAQLPDPADRAEFATVFPVDYYRIFRFDAHESDTWPASITFGYGVFSRQDFPAWLERQTKPKKAFNPPDVRGLKLAGVPELAQARCRWWIANLWPITATERQWIWEHARELFPEAKRCPEEEVELLILSKRREQNGK